MAKAGKKVKTIIKLNIPAGEATPAPPVGPALGAHGINIGEFIKAFNDKTQDKKGNVLPVEIKVFEDRTFTFITKTPPTSFLIKKALGLEKGSGEPNKRKVGKLTKDKLKEIAQTKLPDLNTENVEAAEKIVAGVARSMGVEVEE